MTTDPVDLLRERVDSYSRDAGVLRQEGQADDAVIYETVAAELQKVAAEMGAP